MSKKLVTIILLLIIFLGAVLRFREIAVNPPNINTDEAAIGYNAYSILKTGRDEYGKNFPLTFRSFDDYKPPLYIYLTVPSVAVFGLNEFAVRFPSAFLGVLAIIMTYFLTVKLFKSAKIGLMASFLLAISPWHIQFTRTAYETGSNAFLTVLGLWLFLKGLEKRWYFLGAAVVFGLQIYLYQASKIFVPLLVGSLFLIFFKYFRSKIGSALFFVIPFLLLMLPMARLATSSTGLLRFQGTSIFQDPKSHDRQIEYQTADWLRNDNKSVTLFHPEFMTYFQDILVGYLSHFRPDFLITNRNDLKIAYVPEFGLVNPWVFPFYLAGFYYLFKRQNKTATAILISWLLISPIPASVTTGLPSSIRTAVFLPSLQIIVAYGLANLFPKLFRPVKVVIFFLAIYFFAFYLHQLFIHAPIVNSKIWYSGYKQVINDSINLADNYQKIIVSTGLDEPHIFYLFYLKYDPNTYLQQDGGTVGGGFKEQSNHFGKYIFHSIDWSKLQDEPGLLLVAIPSEVPPDAKDHIIGKYFSLDGQLIAYLLRTK